MVVEIRLDNGVSQVTSNLPKNIENAIDDACHYMEPNFFMMKRAMEAKGRFMNWDGKKHLFNTKTYSFMTGLLSLVCGAINATGNEFKIDDIRVKPRKVHDLEWQYPFPARTYQLEAVKKGLLATRGVFEIAAGGGKSFVAMKTIQELGVKTLYTVNTRIALKSTMEEAELSFGKKNPLVVRWDPKKKEVGEFLTVITMASAVKHLNQLKTHAFNMIVADESHHIASDTWKQVVTTLKPYYAYGLSGTNFRMDGKDKLLLATTGRPIVKILTADLIRLGYLTAANVTFIDVPVPKGINMPFQNYAELYTLGIIENEWRNRLASELVRQHLGEQTLLVIDKIVHGETLLAEIQKFYPEAMFLHGKSKKNEEHIQRFIDGELKVIVASKIFNESINIPNLKVVINASGGKSGIAVLQRIARALRLHDSKDMAVIYDFNDIFNYKLEEHSRERIKWLKKDKHNVKEVTAEELGIQV